MVFLMLLHRHLPDRTLIKYEVDVMLKLTIIRNVYTGKGRKGMIEFTFAVYSKLIYESRLVDAI